MTFSFSKFLVLLIIVFSQNILDSLIKHYEKHDNYVIKFEYVSKNKNEIILKNKGKIMYSNKKFRITLDEIVFIYDGKNYFNIVKENMEVNIMKNNELSNYLIPNNLSKTIKKNRNKIKIKKTENFQISYTDDNDNKYLIDIDKNYNILKINQSITESYSNIIYFDKILFNQNLDESLFVFSKSDYDGYYINEL